MTSINNFWSGASVTVIALAVLFTAIYLATGWKLDMVRPEKVIPVCVKPAHEPTKGKGKQAHEKNAPR